MEFWSKARVSMPSQERSERAAMNNLFFKKKRVESHSKEGGIHLKWLAHELPISIQFLRKQSNNFQLTEEFEFMEKNIKKK